MMTIEQARQHRLAADRCNLNGCSHVESLFSDRAELQAENERLRAALEEITAQEYLSDPDSEGHGDCVRIAVAALEGDSHA